MYNVVVREVLAHEREALFKTRQDSVQNRANSSKNGLDLRLDLVFFSSDFQPISAGVLHPTPPYTQPLTLG